MLLRGQNTVLQFSDLPSLQGARIPDFLMNSKNRNTVCTHSTVLQVKQAEFFLLLSYKKLYLEVENNTFRYVVLGFNLVVKLSTAY